MIARKNEEVRKAKNNVAKHNNRAKQNGAGRNRLSNNVLESRARKLGITDIQDIKKFKEQIRSGNIDAAYWSKKYPHSADLKDLNAYFKKNGFKKQVKKRMGVDTAVEKQKAAQMGG